jgi:hypothetical protein
MNIGHQWATFQKGRLKVKACSCCGEMSLPSNSQVRCQQGGILNSPIIKAGYTISINLPRAVRTSSFAASL